jgi:hypothetical protein
MREVRHVARMVAMWVTIPSRRSKGNIQLQRTETRSERADQGTFSFFYYYS